MNSYSEALEFLYARLPMFSRDGFTAYKKDLYRTQALCEALGNPHRKLKCIHIAGTNGKGSSSHMIASVLAHNGYKTGLYTSPHLLDFRERIRVNGELLDADYFVDFIKNNQKLIADVEPSFFELTVAMSFHYFVKQGVDIAVIETGLGGRLDSTNIITPILSMITNIGLDHADLLGNTLPDIAKEKAGIIKKCVPVVISEHNPESDSVFIQVSKDRHAPIFFAEDLYNIKKNETNEDFLLLQVNDIRKDRVFSLQLDLKGSYQSKNVLGVLTVIEKLSELGYHFNLKKNQEALSQVQKFTGLQGRWQTLSKDPLVICDTGHNEHGFKQVLENIQKLQTNRLHMVIGMMKDKDIDSILGCMPSDATYYFCKPQLPRAMESEQLKQKAAVHGLFGTAHKSVIEAVDSALEAYQSGSLIFIGGSTFVVAEALAMKW